MIISREPQNEHRSWCNYLQTEGTPGNVPAAVYGCNCDYAPELPAHIRPSAELTLGFGPK